MTRDDRQFDEATGWRVFRDDWDKVREREAKFLTPPDPSRSRHVGQA